MLSGRKRTYASRARSTSRAAKKTKTTSAVMALNNRVRYPLQDRARSTRTICRWSVVAKAINSPIAGVNALVYSLNGLFDPDISGVGDQPTGFDEYMALYSKYTVLATKVKIKALNADSEYPQICGATVTALDGTTTDPNVYIRNGTPQWHILGRYGDGNNQREWTMDVDIQQLSKSNILVDPQFSGISNSNPDNQWYLQIWSGGHDGSDAGNVYWYLEFEYLTEFREPATTLNS